MTEAIEAPAAIGEWRPDQLDAPSVEADIEMLGEVLHAAVHGGAGVSFVVPFSLDEARGFWRDKVLPAARARTRRVLLARQGPRIVGTVQLELALPPNQRHRAEVAKLLVHPGARRRGIARTLMKALEAVARSEGRTLLTLDTVTGSGAEPLYLSLGYAAVGVIPGYARASLTQALEAATIMYKQLAPAERGVLGKRTHTIWLRSGVHRSDDLGRMHHAASVLTRLGYGAEEPWMARSQRKDARPLTAAKESSE